MVMKTMLGHVVNHCVNCLNCGSNGNNIIVSSYWSKKLALKTALLNANQEDIIYVGGSTFVVAEII